MSRYKKSQYTRQEDLVNNSDIFNGDKGNGYFMGKPRHFVLKDGMNNLYEPIRNDVLRYFKDNDISWWGGDKPSKLVYAKKKKIGFYIFIIATILVLLLGIIRSDTFFFILAGVISVITIILMSIKSHGRNAFQILQVI